MADPHRVDVRLRAEVDDSGRYPKDQIAVEGRMGRLDCSGNTVLCRLGHAKGSGLVEPSIGRDDRDRRIGAGCQMPGLSRPRQIEVRRSDGGRKPSEFGGELERRGKKCSAVRPGHAAERVDRDERPHGQPVVEDE
jgi:hypothetical protein